MSPTITVWWADLTAADTALEAALPAAERDRLEGLAGADRARRAVGSALLLHALGPAERAAAAAPAVDRTCEVCGAQHGRPVVEGGPFVSVAHAGVLVVVATCAQAPVGVDVERVSRFGETDGADGAAVWVEREARLKAGPADGAPSQVRPLEPPLPGYAAALVVRSRDVPAVTVRRVTGLGRAAAP